MNISQDFLIQLFVSTNQPVLNLFKSYLTARTANRLLCSKLWSGPQVGQRVYLLNTNLLTLIKRFES